MTKQTKTKPKCIKGTACGYTCISGKKQCSDRILKRDADALLASVQAFANSTTARAELQVYNIVRTLGSGAYGATVLTDRGTAVKTDNRVFEGEWIETDRQVAEITAEYGGLKLMHSLSIGPEPIALSIKTGQIEMEFVEGQTVYEARKSMTRLEEYKLADTVAVSIAKLHKAGYTHNDLHQNNVLVQNDGSVKVIDAGMIGKVGELAAGSDKRTNRNGLDDMVRQFGPGCKGNLRMSDLYDRLETEGVLDKYRKLRDEADDLPMSATQADINAIYSKAEKYMHSEYLARLGDYYDF